MIDMAALGRRYGSRVAVHPLTVIIPAGHVVGFLGANGAGKTTTLNMLATILEPSEGTARVAGFDVRESPLEVRRHIGYVPEHAASYDGLTADEHLELAARIRGLPEATWRPRADRLLEHLGIAADRGRRLGSFSRGMRTKAVLAGALLHDPAVLLLDEPMNGLDVAAQAVLAALLRDLANDGRTVVYSSHVLDQVERVCDYLLVIDHGRLLWHGDTQALLAEHAGASLSDIFLRITASHAGGTKPSWSAAKG